MLPQYGFEIVAFELPVGDTLLLDPVPVTGDTSVPEEDADDAEAEEDSDECPQ